MGLYGEESRGVASRRMYREKVKCHVGCTSSPSHVSRCLFDPWLLKHSTLPSTLEKLAKSYIDNYYSSCHIHIITMASLTELFQFLDSPNPSARHLALQNLVGHTAKNQPQRHIFIPSLLAGSSGGLGSGSGLVPEKRKSGSEEDEIKIKALKDLCALCSDQAVGGPCSSSASHC